MSNQSATTPTIPADPVVDPVYESTQDKIRRVMAPDFIPEAPRVDLWKKYYDNQGQEFNQKYADMLTGRWEETVARRQQIHEQLLNQRAEQAQLDMEAAPLSYWESPLRIGRMNQLLNNLPADVEKPTWATPEVVSTFSDAFKFLSASMGSDWEKWPTELSKESGLRQMLRALPAPNDAQIPAWDALLEQSRQAVAAAEQQVQDALANDPQAQAVDEFGIPVGMNDRGFLGMPSGLQPWQYATLLLRSQGGQVAQNAWVGANIGKGLGPWGAAGGAAVNVAAGGAMAKQMQKEAEEAAAGKPIERAWVNLNPFDPTQKTYLPTATELMEAINWPFDQAGKLLGLIEQVSGAAFDPETYGTLEEIGSNFTAAWEAGGNSTFWQLFEWAGLTPKTKLNEAGQQVVQTWDAYKVGPTGETVLPSSASGGTIDYSAYMMAIARRQIAQGVNPKALAQQLQATVGDAGALQEILAGIFLDPLDKIISETPKAFIGFKAGLDGNVTLLKSLDMPVRRLGMNVPTAGDEVRNYFGSIAQAVVDVKNKPTPGNILRMVGAFVPEEKQVWDGLKDYRTELLSMRPDQLETMGSWTRWFAGVDEQGMPKYYRSADSAGKSPLPVRMWDALWGATAASRASHLANDFLNAMDQMLVGVKDETDMVNTVSAFLEQDLENVVRTADGARTMTLKVGGVDTQVNVPRWWDSAEAAPVLLSMKDGSVNVRALLSDFVAASDQRNRLKIAAEALSKASPTGKTPIVRDVYDLKAQLHNADANELKVLAQRIRDAGYTDIDIKNLENLKRAADAFYDSRNGKRKAVSFDAADMRTRIMGVMDKSVGDFSVQYFGVRPDGWAIRLSNVVKKMQSYALLGYNPSYMLNNAISNWVHMAWDGLLGSSLPGENRRSWWNRLLGAEGEEGMPARLRTEDTGQQAGVGGAEKGKTSSQEAIRKAKRGEDAIQKLDDALTARGAWRYILAPFASLSGKIEEWSSEVAMTSAARKFWDAHWRPGVGFDRMTSELRAVIDTLGMQSGIENLSRKIEKAIQRGMSKDEIEAAVFKFRDAPSLKDIMTPEETELLNSFPDLLDNLDKSIRDGNGSRQAIATAIDKVGKDFEKRVSREITKAIKKRMADMAATAAIEKLPGILDQIDGWQHDLLEFWNSHMDAMQEAADLAQEVEGSGGSAWLVWEQAREEARANWDNYQMVEIATWQGILEGMQQIGKGDEARTTALLALLDDKNESWRGYFETMQQDYAAYRAWRETPGPSGKKPTEREASARWAAMHDKFNDEYLKAALWEDQINGQLDAGFLRDYPGDIAQAQVWRGEMRQVRRRMMIAEIMYRMGRLPEGMADELLKNDQRMYIARAGKQAVGDLNATQLKEYSAIARPNPASILGADTTRAIQALNYGHPWYTIETSTRRDNARAYADIRRGFLRDMEEVRNKTAPGGPSAPPKPGEQPAGPAPTPKQAAPEAQPAPAAQPESYAGTPDHIADIQSRVTRWEQELANLADAPENASRRRYAQEHLDSLKMELEQALAIGNENAPKPPADSSSVSGANKVQSSAEVVPASAEVVPDRAEIVRSAKGKAPVKRARSASETVGMGWDAFNSGLNVGDVVEFNDGARTADWVVTKVDENGRAMEVISVEPASKTTHAVLIKDGNILDASDYENNRIDLGRSGSAEKAQPAPAQAPADSSAVLGAKEVQSSAGSADLVPNSQAPGTTPPAPESGAAALDRMTAEQAAEFEARNAPPVEEPNAPPKPKQKMIPAEEMAAMRIKAHSLDPQFNDNPAHIINTIHRYVGPDAEINLDNLTRAMEERARIRRDAPEAQKARVDKRKDTNAEVIGESSAAGKAVVDAQGSATPPAPEIPRTPTLDRVIAKIAGLTDKIDYSHAQALRGLIEGNAKYLGLDPDEWARLYIQDVLFGDGPAELWKNEVADRNYQAFLTYINENPGELMANDTAGAMNDFVTKMRALVSGAGKRKVGDAPWRVNEKTMFAIDISSNCPYRQGGYPCVYCYVEQPRSDFSPKANLVYNGAKYDHELLKLADPAAVRKMVTDGVQGKIHPDTGQAWTSAQIEDAIATELEIGKKYVEWVNTSQQGMRVFSVGDWLDDDWPTLKSIFDDAEKIGLKLKVITKQEKTVKTLLPLYKNVGFNLSVDFIPEHFASFEPVIRKRLKVAIKNDLANGELYDRQGNVITKLTEAEIKARVDQGLKIINATMTSTDGRTLAGYGFSMDKALELRALDPRRIAIRYVAMNRVDNILATLNPNIHVVTAYHSNVAEANNVMKLWYRQNSYLMGIGKQRYAEAKVTMHNILKAAKLVGADTDIDALLAAARTESGIKANPDLLKVLGQDAYDQLKAALGDIRLAEKEAAYNKYMTETVWPRLVELGLNKTPTMPATVEKIAENFRSVQKQPAWNEKEVSGILHDINQLRDKGAAIHFPKEPGKIKELQVISPEMPLYKFLQEFMRYEHGTMGRQSVQALASIFEPTSNAGMLTAGRMDRKMVEKALKMKTGRKQYRPGGAITREELEAITGFKVTDHELNYINQEGQLVTPIFRKEVEEALKRDLTDAEFETFLDQMISKLCCQTGYCGKCAVGCGLAKGTQAAISDKVNLLNKLMESGPRASVFFEADGRAIIRALKSSTNVSDLAHELGHVFRRTLNPDDLDIASKDVGARNIQGSWVWDREHEEAFADRFEVYLRQGLAPTPELRGVFEKFKAWLMDIYKQLTGQMDVEISPELRGVFDRMLGKEDYIPEGPNGPKLSEPAPTIFNRARAKYRSLANWLYSMMGNGPQLISYESMESGANVTKYKRESDNPEWYVRIYEAADESEKRSVRRTVFRALKVLESGDVQAWYNRNGNFGQWIMGRLLAAADQIAYENGDAAHLWMVGNTESAYEVFSKLQADETKDVLTALGDDAEYFVDSWMAWMSGEEPPARPTPPEPQPGGFTLQQQTARAQTPPAQQPQLFPTAEPGAQGRKVAREDLPKRRDMLFKQIEEIRQENSFMFKQGQTAPTFYSQLLNSVEAIPQERMTVGQLRGMLTKGQVKADELKWSGLDEFLAGKGPNDKITRAEVLEFIQQNNIQVTETVLGEPDRFDWKPSKDGRSWSRKIGNRWSYVHQLRDGTFTAQSPSGLIRPFDTEAEAKAYVDSYSNAVTSKPTKYGNTSYVLPGGTNERELVFSVPSIEPYMPDDSAHFADTSGGRVVAWVRFNERVDSDGKKVLFIEEIQSNRHQEGRQNGYQTTIPTPQNAEEFSQSYKISESMRQFIVQTKDGKDVLYYGKDNKQIASASDKIDAVINAALRDLSLMEVKSKTGVPPAPFSKTWPDLAMKRMIRWAAENGYDRVAWTTGKQQADRYNLAKQVKQIKVTPWVGDTGMRLYDISVDGMDGRRIISDDGMSIEQVKDNFGDDLAKRMEALPAEQSHVFEGEDDLSVGGEGMRGFYDQILPATVQKYIKKWGATVGESDIFTGVEPGGISQARTQRDGDQWVVQVFEPDINEWSDSTWFDTKAEALDEVKAITSDVRRVAETVHSFDVTPEMKASVMEQGQPLFKSDAPEDRSISEKRWEVYTPWSNSVVQGNFATKAEAERFIPPDAEGWVVRPYDASYGPANTPPVDSRMAEAPTAGQKAVRLETVTREYYQVGESLGFTRKDLDKFYQTIMRGGWPDREMYQANPLNAKKLQNWVEEIWNTQNNILYKTDDGAMMPPGTVDSLKELPDMDLVHLQGLIQQVQPALRNIRRKLMEGGRYSANKVMDVNRTADPRTMAMLRAYLGRVYGQMSDTKLATVKMGESGRNRALLDYTARTGMDNLLGVIMPYQYWYTRSALNWGLRSLTRPSILANYARLKKNFSDDTEREGFPTRLKGKMKLYAPWLPEFMGDTLYIDPLKQIFPFEMLSRPFEKYSDNQNMISKRAEGILADMVTNEDITAEQARAAIENQSGKLWDDAYARAEVEVGGYDTSSISAPIGSGTARNFLDLMWSVSGPSMPVSWAYKTLTGRKEDIGMLPVSAFIQNMTAAMGVGGPRGVNIEAGIRQALGLPEFSKFEDYSVDREISNMVADGLITADQGVRTMIDRAGDIFQEAQRRVSAESALKYVMGPVAADVFPEGEEEMRNLRLVFQKALDAKAAGAKDALTRFYEKYPEYAARSASFQEPEQRLRKFLISDIWNGWNGLSSVQKDAVTSEFGSVFTDAFINKTTRSYDSIDVETLADWAKAMGGKLPQAAPKTPQGKTVKDLVDPKIVTGVDVYNTQKDKLFPGIGSVLNVYYDLTPAGQKAMAKRNPSIDKYLAWNTQFLADNPSLIPYLIGETNELAGLPNAIQGYVYQYRARRTRLFPRIFDTQTAYFNILDEAEQKVFLEKHPELTRYWDWRKQFAAAYPQASPYILGEESLQNYIIPGYNSTGGSSSGSSSKSSTTSAKKASSSGSNQAQTVSAGRTYTMRYENFAIPMTVGMAQELAAWGSGKLESLSGTTRAAMERAWSSNGEQGDMNEWIKIYAVQVAEKLANHPPVLSQAEVGRIQPSLMRQVVAHLFAGETLGEGARRELEAMMQEIGISTTVEDFVQRYIRPTLR